MAGKLAPAWQAGDSSVRFKQTFALPRVRACVRACVCVCVRVGGGGGARARVRKYIYR